MVEKGSKDKEICWRLTAIISVSSHAGTVVQTKFHGVRATMAQLICRSPTTSLVPKFRQYLTFYSFFKHESCNRFAWLKLLWTCVAISNEKENQQQQQAIGDSYAHLYRIPFHIWSWFLWWLVVESIFCMQCGCW